MASQPPSPEARRHAEMHEMLRTRLEQRHRKRPHNVPIKTQCPSPQLTSLSSTPSFETSSVDYTSSQDIKTSLQLLVEQQPGSYYFDLAADKILRHSLSGHLLRHSMISAASWSSDLRRSLRTAGADEIQQKVVMQHLYDLAATTFTSFLLELSPDHIQTACSSPIKTQASQDHSRSLTAACPKRRECIGSPVKANDSHRNKRRKLDPEDKPLPGSYSYKLRVLDLETWLSSDRDQRVILARQACSLPIELYFHHLRHALPEDSMDYEQASLIWSKLNTSQTEQWKALLERLRDGDLAAASTDGADLLVEHDVLEKLEPQDKQPTTATATGDVLKGIDPVRDPGKQRLTRSQASKAQRKPSKSPYF